MCETLLNGQSPYKVVPVDYMDPRPLHRIQQLQLRWQDGRTDTTRHSTCNHFVYYCISLASNHEFKIFSVIPYTAYIINSDAATVNTLDAFILVITCPVLGMFYIMQNHKELQIFIQINYGGHIKILLYRPMIPHCAPVLFFPKCTIFAE
jgi:hypothetical protein